MSHFSPEYAHVVSYGQPEEPPSTLGPNNRDSIITTTSMTSTGTTSSTNTTTSTSSASTSSSALTGTSYTSGSSSSRRSSTSTRDYRRSSIASSAGQLDLLELEEMIYKVKEQLDFHKQRADKEEHRANEAERKLLEYADQLARVNKARLVAQQEANKANEELRLYKIQLEYAQREINRAQSVLDLVEKQRASAEREAIEAKAKARKLNEEIVVETARREGRRQGLQEGLDRGRKLIMQEVEAATSIPDRRTSFPIARASFMDDDFGSDTDDSGTISTESHITLQADRRPRPRSQVLPQHAPSPSPIPVPVPRPSSRASAAPEPRAPSRAATVVPESRPASRAPSAIGDPRPASRAPSSLSEVRPSSRAPSVVAATPASRAPTVLADPRPPSRAPSAMGDTRPPSRATSVAQEPPRPHSRAPSVSYFSPGPLHMDYTIPPDNLIPTLVDGVLSIPPAFEFHRMPTTPEKQPPPILPNESLDSNPAGYHDRRGSTESDSASTTLSHIDLLKDPYNGQVAATPALSAIEEVSSQAMSPYQPDWRRQSVAGSSVGRGGGGSVVGSPYVAPSHQRRQSTSSFVPSIHERPPSAMSRASKSASVAGTQIDINIQPPSQPGTEGTRSIGRSEQFSPLTAAGVPLPSSYRGSPAGSTHIGMPGSMVDGSQIGSMARGPSPVPSAISKDDDAVSSRISGDGDDFFTTPPGAAAAKLTKAESVVSGVSARTSRTSKSKASKKSRK